MARIGIAGAGLLGRLLAWQLATQGHEVTVHDAQPGPGPRWDGQGPAGFTAAGMLSPVAELETAPVALARLGARSLPRWQAHARALAPHAEGAALVTLRGSLLLAHRSDRGAAQRVLDRLARAGEAGLPPPCPLDGAALAALEPAIQGVAHVWRLDGEGQVDAPAMLQVLHAAATTAGARWQWGRAVVSVGPGWLGCAEGTGWHGDLAIDVRGAGARGPAGEPVWPQHPLRGVRGETVWLHAPGVALQRPVRLLHARHRVYLVPRPGDVILIGASEIESEDRSPVSLKTAVELMTAAHSVLPGLAEARILRLDRNLRPALPDHAPHVEARPGLLRLNGLFRHGWLLAPALVDDALAAAGLGPAAAPEAVAPGTDLGTNLGANLGDRHDMNPHPAATPLATDPVRVQLDGRAHALPAGSDLAALLQAAGLAPASVGTALNGRFVPRAGRAGCRLSDGDVVLTFNPIVGG